jgi:hypothetical protein
VIVLHEDPETQAKLVYLGTFGGLEGPDEGRYVVLLKHVQFAGMTEHNWKTFAETNRNPIRYLL